MPRQIVIVVPVGSWQTCFQSPGANGFVIQSIESHEMLDWWMNIVVEVNPVGLGHFFIILSSFI